MYFGIAKGKSDSRQTPYSNDMHEAVENFGKEGNCLLAIIIIFGQLK